MHEAQPYCMPMLYGNDLDYIYLQGASTSPLMRELASGVRSCTNITTLDSLVLARSIYEQSANYVSVIVFGSYEAITTEDEKLAVLKILTEQLIPGRWREVRPPSLHELRATSILRLPLAEVWLKHRSGGPNDDESVDAAIETWAGILPIDTRFGEPIASEGLRAGIGLSPSVERLVVRLGRSSYTTR